MTRARAAARAAAAALVAALAAGASAQGAAAARGPHLLRLVSGLVRPTYVAAAPGDRRRLFVVEQPGLIRVLEAGRLRAAPFLDVRRLVSCCGERGLLSVAFAPDWPASRRFWVDYTNTAGDTRVVEYRADATGARALPGSARVLLAVAQPYPNHNGGQLQIGPDGSLYVGMGDGGSAGDPENRAQDPASPLGKLLRIDTRTGKATQAAMGLRNPWRFSFDSLTRDLWIGDVGQDAWEEVDHVRTSDLPLNFGWSVWEGRARFRADRSPPPSPPLAWPVAVYGHDVGCSITGGYVYRGTRVASLRGRYVFGDYCSGRIWSIPATAVATGPTGPGATPRLEPITVDALSSFGLDAQGELLAVSLSGTISRIVP